MTRTLLAALLAVLATTGCSSFYVEAEQPQACIQLVTPQSFPLVISSGPGSISTVINIGLNNAIPDFVLNGSAQTHVVSFLGAEVTLNGPNGDVPGGLTNLRVTAISPGAPSVVLIDYTPATAPTSATFSLPPRQPGNNVISLLQNGGLSLEVDITYSSIQTGAWSAGVDACFSAKVKKTFDELINGG